MLNRITPKVRDRRFAREGAIPAIWHGRGSGVTRFFDSLSICIPAGERFFIHAIKQQLPQIADPVLRREVELFCTQEALHNREHEHYNARIAENAPCAIAMDRRAQRVLKLAKKILTPNQQLAVTCAIEHFTAVMGHHVLSEPEVLAEANSEMAALWRWHSVEETEHKAVAFDAYKAVGGSERDRVVMMAITATVFWFLMIEQTARLMHADHKAFSLREWAKLVRFLYVEPGGMWTMTRMMLDYYRPSFHPWNLDNRALITL